MAVESMFNYRQGHSWIYRHHPLCKVVELCVVALFLGLSSIRGIMGIVIFQFLLFVLSGISLLQVGRQLIRFIYLFLLVGLGAWFSSGGGSEEQILAVAEKIIQFAGYIAAGLFFTLTTRPSEVSRIVYKLCKWVPGIHAGAVASFIQNVLAMIPAIFNSLDQVGVAVISRSGKRVGPVRKGQFLSFGLLVNSLLHASAFSDALESRAYNPERSQYLQPVLLKDIIICCLYISFVVCLYYIQLIYSCINSLCLAVL